MGGGKEKNGSKDTRLTDAGFVGFSYGVPGTSTCWHTNERRRPYGRQMATKRVLCLVGAFFM